MIWRFVQFWIDNSKFTILFILLSIFVWTVSWFFIPKQYNPEIIVSAFQIVVEVPWYNTNEVQKLIVEPLENKLNEIEWVEHIYSSANKNYAWFMIMFYVWIDRELATTRLYNKINSNMDQKPKWVEQILIKSIDPDDIPIYSFVVKSELENDEINLRKIWIDITENFKKITNVSSIYINWWQQTNINIKVDIDKLQAKNIDLIQIVDAIKKNNISLNWWDLNVDDRIFEISLNWVIDNIEKFKKLLISFDNWIWVYLDELATIDYWISNQKDFQFYWDSQNFKNWIFIWLAKKKWTNSVFVVDEIKKEIEKIKPKLGDNYKIYEIQNEWVSAKNSTDKLLFELINAVILLFFVMSIFLWFKDWISSSLAIPIVLSIIFFLWILFWDNINRISLFALILVLWMLVDDSIIVVENISRHFKLNKSTWKSKIEIIKDWVNQIAPAVVFSTLTKIIAFCWMFFVWWMMGQYMWPIPKYAILALSISLVVAFTINPFISYILHKTPKPDNNKINLQDYKIDKTQNEINIIKNLKLNYVEKLYFNLLNYFLSNNFRIKLIKFLFWILLIFVIIIPPTLWIFKMRMLPKSDKDQIFLWIDTPKSFSISQTKQIWDEVYNFMKDYFYNSKLDSSLNIDNQMKIVENISFFIWNAPLSDFANSFRFASNRVWENYISTRINLISEKKREITSEMFTIKLREKLEPFLKQKSNDIKIFLLEEPPWPPVRSTFMLQLKSNDENIENLSSLAKWINSKISYFLIKENVVDTYTTIDTYKTDFKINLDHEKIIRAYLDIDNIIQTIYILFNWTNIDIFHLDNTKQQLWVYISAENYQRDNIEQLKNLNFINKFWQKISLIEVAQIEPQQVEQSINSDDRQKVIYIFWEMWDNSVIYPIIWLFRSFLDKNFWEWKYEILNRNLYWINIKDLYTNNEIYLKFWWEWELTIDTFRDLWSALIIALLWLYILVSLRFKNFTLWWIVMLSFLLWIFWIMPWFSILFLMNNEYFSATALIWVIALAWIVIWNSIIMIDYFIELKEKWMSLKDSILYSWTFRLKPIFLTSLTAILWAMMIIWDPVWNWLAYSLIFWLSASFILTLIFIPIFVYDNLNEIKK